jgi:hypothetical protein
MQQNTEYAKYTLFPWPSVLLQHRNTALTVLHVSVCLCMDSEQQQKFAEPDVINPELKSAFRYPRQKMFIPFTQGCKFLDIHLVLRLKSLTIKIVLLNEENCDPNQLNGKVQCRI